MVNRDLLTACYNVKVASSDDFLRVDTYSAPMTGYSHISHAFNVPPDIDDMSMEDYYEYIASPNFDVDDEDVDGCEIDVDDFLVSCMKMDIPVELSDGDDDADVISLPSGCDNLPSSCSDLKELVFSYLHSRESSCIRAYKSVYDLVHHNASSFQLFGTFTFSPESVDRYDYASCAILMNRYLESLRKKYVDLKYIVIPEKHKDGAFHFHALFSSDFAPECVFSNHVFRRGTVSRCIYNVPSWNYGFTNFSVVFSVNATANYVMKYIAKDVSLQTVPYGKKRYWASRNLIRPKKDFALLNHDSIDILETILTTEATYSSSFESTYFANFGKKVIHKVFILPTDRAYDILNYINMEVCVYDESGWDSKSALRA